MQPKFILVRAKKVYFKELVVLHSTTADVRKNHVTQSAMNKQSCQWKSQISRTPQFVLCWRWQPSQIGAKQKVN